MATTKDVLAQVVSGQAQIAAALTALAGGVSIAPPVVAPIAVPIAPAVAAAAIPTATPAKAKANGAGPATPIIAAGQAVRPPQIDLGRLAWRLSKRENAMARIDGQIIGPDSDGKFWYQTGHYLMPAEAPKTDKTGQ